MTLKLHNSLTRQLEDFTPINKDAVGLYTCGPTVYNYPHIGNYRAYLFCDLLKRTLLALGFGVNHIMNITDIDDKTIRDSIAAKKSLLEFTEFYTEAFFADRDSLMILPASRYTKATDHVADMVLLIEILLEKEYAYKTEDGSVYFSIKKDADYGKLTHLDLDQLKDNASGRLSTNTQGIIQDEYSKEDASDFALWKAWDENDGPVFWETSLGKGRPGWHIECSAMSMRYLGTTIDIHTGGIDNMFPHHENEIAQSESVTNKPFVNYFLHNEHLLVDGKKMSKSLGNFYVLSDITAKGYRITSYRYLSLLSHYRTPQNFTWEALQAAQNALESIQTFYALNYISDVDHIHREYKETFLASLANDINTSGAVATVWDLIRDDSISMEVKIGTLTYFDQVLGLDIGHLVVPRTSEIDTLLHLRDQARAAKNFAESDRLRNDLELIGLSVFDTKDGTKVIKKF